jgi:predicted RNA-binding Zn ribbon-like protein
VAGVSDAVDGAAGGARQRDSRQVRELRFDAGSLALNLVCTVGRRGARPVERMGGRAAASGWLERVGLPVVDDELNDDLLRRLHSLREALHQVLRGLADGGAATSGSVELVNACARGATPVPQLCWSPDAPSVLGVTRRDVHTAAEVLAVIARDGIAHVDDPDRRARLSVCAAADCRMLYLNTTAGRRRQWCSMRHCGNRAKAARHRARLSSPNASDES